MALKQKQITLPNDIQLKEIISDAIDLFQNHLASYFKFNNFDERIGLM